MEALKNRLKQNVIAKLSLSIKIMGGTGIKPQTFQALAQD
jgi:copper homeostasis protein CutC